VRTTDPEPERFKGLGEKVQKPAPAPASSSQKPQGKSGIVTDENGMLKTTNHKPYAAMTLEEAIWNWREIYAEEGRVDFLP
jgi:hypothetical protein